MPLANRRGGARPGAGRKSRAEELGLIHLLDRHFPVKDRAEVLTVLCSKAKDGDMRAIELILAYTFGKPIERTETNVSGEVGIYQVDIGTDDSSS